MLPLLCRVMRRVADSLNAAVETITELRPREPIIIEQRRIEPSRLFRKFGTPISPEEIGVKPLTKEDTKAAFRDAFRGYPAGLLGPLGLVKVEPRWSPSPRRAASLEIIALLIRVIREVKKMAEMDV